MALPRGDQYNEAVQNPALSFLDADLKASRVEADSWGLPKPYSGGFAVTFKLIHLPDSWAVRCLVRDITGLHQKYQAITDFFSTHSSIYFIEAKFIQNGIRIDGSFYPIIKMKWMEGDPVNIYLSNHYNNKSKVNNLLNNFQHLIAELEHLGIAHGDLQQGNIIVKNDKLYLIDYDGMYLPALKGQLSHEIGHPNFQHPQRSARDFNEKIDRFSSIVIYLSLHALLHKPSLWNKYHNGDNFIIKNNDIADLSQSAVIADLNAISELQPLVERFIGVCHLDFSQIPSLKDYISGNFTYDKSKIGKIAVKASQYDLLDGKMKATILEHFGERVEVIGFLSGIYKGRTYNGKPYYFLNMGKFPMQTFTITVWSEGINSLTNSGLSPESLVNHWVSIIGVITSYKGLPQTVAEQASQIQILPNEKAAKQKLQLNASSTPKRPGTLSHNTGNVTPPKYTDKEAKIMEDLYGNFPTSKPSTQKPSTTNQPPKTKPTYTNSPYSTPPSYGSSPTSYGSTSYHTTSSSSVNKKSRNTGCIVPVICAFLGAIILGSITDGKSWIQGAIIGGIIGALFSKAFK